VTGRHGLMDVKQRIQRLAAVGTREDDEHLGRIPQQTAAWRRFAYLVRIQAISRLQARLQKWFDRTWKLSHSDWCISEISLKTCGRSIANADWILLESY
jgi:hypothetical protein